LLLFVFNLDVLVAVAEKKGGDGGEEEDGGGDKGIVRLTKTERRAKLKKSKKEAKKLGKQVENTEQVTPQAAVLVSPPPLSLSLYI
jgi:nucleolar complex protein 3